ncbi:MAG: orotidine-5'-phosphate decarboxylase [Chloroflexota bacterium]
MTPFYERLREAIRSHRSLVCVGLDPDPALMPEVGVLEFNKAIIDATWDLACAYKLNLAFYEALGIDGLVSMQKTVEHIAKPVIVIGDGKRADIGSTSRAYARSLFDVSGFDAVTVNPYLGTDSVGPFLEYEDKGVFILCRTSNEGAKDFQGLLASPSGQPLFEVVAEKARLWNTRGNVGLVAGATYPLELRRIRELCPEMPLLIPGVGAQGGDLGAVVKYGVDSRGEGVLINSSRGIIYASKGKDFATAARGAARQLRDEIDSHLARCAP